MKSNRDHIRFCLHSIFKSGFYVVDFPQINDTAYEQHYPVLAWLRELDNYESKHLISQNDGLMFFAEYENALQFMLTWGDVKL